MATTARDRGTLAPDSRRWKAAAEVALVFLVFVIHAAWAVPDVNEPHYLGKARHYWDPAWCASDFFLQTADAHEAFYFAFGWLTLWLPLPAVAWVGRIVSWALLAWAWCRLSAALIPGWLYGVLSAALFVALNSRFHMAGEWVVGGIEGKSFAYVFVLLGLESLVRNRWGWALVLFGAASAFHVIVGGWCVVATIVAWGLVEDRPPLASLVAPAIVGFLLSLPGLVPALALTWDAAADVVTAANRIYVYQRLDHHLLPATLPAWHVVRHLLLVAALVVLVRVAPTEAPFRRLRAFVAASVGIAAVGMAISMLAWWQPDFAAALLRYYWFRMSDAMVPLGVALLASALVCRWQHQRHRAFALGLVAAMLAGGLHLVDTMWTRHLYPTPPADWRVAEYDDWRAVCDWAAAETPPDALFLVPRRSQTFRWYAGRGEVVTQKDLPQDAASIVAWWQRLTDIYGPLDTPANGSLAERGTERLLALGKKYDADYVVTSANPRLPLVRVGPLTGALAVYELPRAEPRQSPGVDQPDQPNEKSF